MKGCLTALLVLGISGQSLCQKDTTFYQVCKRIKQYALNSHQIRRIEVDTCNHQALIEDLDATSDFPINNGLYIEYWDTSFINIKCIGFFTANIPVGYWEEYYPNGKVRYQGQCKIFSYFAIKNKDGLTDSIKAVDETVPDDTIKVKLTNTFLDSMAHLTQFYLHDAKIAGKFFFGLPSSLSLKTGIWKYYDESGMPTKVEYYYNGKFVK